AAARTRRLASCGSSGTDDCISGCVWRRNRAGMWFPDRHRGVLVHLDELPAFLEAVAAAADLARAHLAAHPAPPAVPDAPAAPEPGPATAPPTRRRRRSPRPAASGAGDAKGSSA